MFYISACDTYNIDKTVTEISTGTIFTFTSDRHELLHWKYVLYDCDKCTSILNNTIFTDLRSCQRKL